MTNSWSLTQEDVSMSSARACALVMALHHQRFIEHWPDFSLGDPQSVHQVRVSLRRAQSVLWVGKNVFPQQDAARFSSVVAETIDLTSPLRELAVLHESIDDLANEVSDAAATVISILQDQLETEYRASLESLQRWCNSENAQQLVKGWRVLSSVFRVGDPDYGEHCYRPIGDIVNSKLKKQNKRVLRDGKIAAKQADAEPWHDLRQEVKQLRYILIGFGGLYPRDDLKPLLKQIRRLQNRLGDYQDASTQRLALERLGAHTPTTESLRAHDLLSPLDYQFRVGGLIEALRHREDDAFVGVLREWEEFQSKSFRRSFNNLINA